MRQNLSEMCGAAIFGFDNVALAYSLLLDRHL